MNTVRIELSQPEQRWVEAKANQRNENGLSNGMNNLAPTNDVKWNRVGLAGEFACCLFYNVKLGGLLKTKGHDLGGFIEVRTRLTPRQKDLGVRKRDLHQLGKFDSAFVLCWAHDYPTIEIVGWKWGLEVMEQGTLMTGGHCAKVPTYFLKWQTLNPPLSLFDEIRNKRVRTITYEQWGRFHEKLATNPQ